MNITIDRPLDLVPDVLDDGTRREFVIGGLSLGALLLTGCGDPDSDPGSSETPPQDGFPVTIEHRHGSTRIPTEPKRVVTVGLTDQDPVFALGVTPVASQPWYTDRVVYPWASEVAPRATTKILPMGELNVEAVAAQNPDLIIGITTDITRQQYDLLSQIAPTVPAPGDPLTMSWQEQTMLIGRALGREPKAKLLVADTEQQFADAAARHPEWAGATAVLASQYISGQLLVYPKSSVASSFLTALGFQIAPGLDEFTDDEFGVPALSAERFDLIDVDLVLWDGLRKNLEAAGLFDVATFNNLDIVKEGRNVFPTEPVANALSFRNVLSLPWALKHLEPLLVAAFDGDPATSAAPAG